MRLGLGIGIDKTNIAAISGGLRARFLGTGTQYTQLGPITRQLTAAMTGDGTQATDLLVTKRFAPNYTGDGTMAASLFSYEYLLSGDGVAAAAYSIRSLNPDYTGALVLIRRSSDNAEKAFYPDSNNELSLTSEDGASTTLSTWIGSDNGFVKTWYDQSGSARNSTQTTTSAQPKIITAGVLNTNNGKAALNTDGSNSFFVFNSFATSGMALIAAGNNTGYGTIISGGDDVSNRFDYGPRIINSYRYFVAESGSNDTLDSGTNVLSNYLYEAYKDSGTFGYTYLNASVESSGTMAYDLQAYTNTNKLFTRNFGGGNSDYIAGDWNEIIIFANDQTSNRATIESNINTFYSIY